MNWIRKISLCIPLLWMPFSMPILAQEADSNNENSTSSETVILPEEDLTVIPENGLGSISVTLEDTKDDLSKANVRFGIVKVADLINGEYTLTSLFEGSQIDLNKLNTANELEKAARKLIEFVDTPDREMMTNDAGMITVRDLKVGVYLLYVIDQADYEYIDPVIVSIPTWDDVDEIMLYDISVYPKHSPLPKPETPDTGVQDSSKQQRALYMLLGSVAMLVAGICMIFSRKRGEKK